MPPSSPLACALALRTPPLPLRIACWHQRGSYNCLEDGAVHMTLDNAYSLIKSKVVIYNFDCLEHELTSGVRTRVRGAGGSRWL